MIRMFKKMPYDLVICLGLLFPDLFPNFSFGEGMRSCFVFLMGIITFLCVVGISAIVSERGKGKKWSDKKELNEIDGWYRFYEPISDLAICISLIVAGYPIMAGSYLFSGYIIRAFKYKELEEYEEEKCK